MGNTNSFVRPKLLNLIGINDQFHFTAHYLKTEDAWVCFSQLRLQDKTEVLASHFNLPKHIVEFSSEEPSGRCLVRFTASPSSYMQRGVLRGTVKPMDGMKKVEIVLD